MRDVDLDGHVVGVDAEDGGGVDGGEHPRTMAVATARADTAVVRRPSLHRGARGRRSAAVGYDAARRVLRRQTRRGRLA